MASTKGEFSRQKGDTCTVQQKNTTEKFIIKSHRSSSDPPSTSSQKSSFQKSSSSYTHERHTISLDYLQKVNDYR